MKSKRNCEECKTPYQPTRSDQKFCGATCRWTFWRKKEKNEAEKNKNLSGINTPEKSVEPQKPLNKNLFDSLRNVPEQKVPETKPKQTQTSEIISLPEKTIEIVEVKQPTQIGPMETMEYKTAIAEKQRVDAFGKHVICDLQECDGEILKVKQSIEELSKSKNGYRKNRFRNTDVDFQDLFGKDLFYDEFDKNIRLQELRQKLEDEELKRLELSGELNKANIEMNLVMNRLKTIPQFEKPKPEIKLPDVKTAYSNLSEIMKSIQLSALKKDEQNAKTIIEERKPVVELIETNLNEARETNAFEEENTFEQEQNTNNPKIVSSRALRDLKFQSFPFVGKWKDFFGLPDYGFHVAVHGKPGEGKSTFCVQFADYLAKNFGKVIYVSGEEGLSKTVQDKIINNGIDNPYLFFADIRSYDEIKTEIQNEYHFIFIDSLDTLRIDAIKLKELKERYPQSAFITISQSTKNGQMRGSQEITHDTDIAVKVENGIASTTKNRFLARGMEFKVFDNFEKPKPKAENLKKIV